MLSTEGFEMVQSGVSFLFQFCDEFGPGHVALKGYSEESCFVADADLLVE